MEKRLAELPTLILSACCSQFELAHLLQSPSALGAFLKLIKIVRELEPEVRGAALNLALQGTEIPGFTLVRHETPGYVEVTTIRELFLRCPLSRMPALLDALLENISGERYRLMCTALGISPAETAIKQAGAAPFLRQNPNHQTTK